jgi:hypothetical protein
MGLIERDRIAEALAEAAFTGQLPALEDEGTGAVERARVVVDFVLDLATDRGAVEALRAARQCIVDYSPQDDAGFYDDVVQVVLDQIDAAYGGQ